MGLAIELCFHARPGRLLFGLGNRRRVHRHAAFAGMSGKPLVMAGFPSHQFVKNAHGERLHCVFAGSRKRLRACSLEAEVRAAQVPKAVLGAIVLVAVKTPASQRSRDFCQLEIQGIVFKPLAA